MATNVTLDDVWIHKGDDPSTYVRCSYTRPARENVDREGEVRRYAGGRFRSIAQVGRRKEVTFTLTWVSNADFDTLASWAGDLVMVRDARGRLVWGVYQSADINDRRAYKEGDVTLTVTEVTHDEEV